MSGSDTDEPTIALEPPARPPGSTARHALGGMIWSGLGFGAQGIGQFLVVIVFARYLTKTDNGVVAAALIVIALGQLFTEAGFGPAVVQRENLTDEHIRTAFALSVLSGLAMTVLVWLSAPLAADFFHQPALTDVMRGLAFVFTLMGPGCQTVSRAISKWPSPCRFSADSS